MNYVSHPDGAQGADPKRAQIDRIAHSSTFRERELLKRLLLYLADRTLDGSAEALKEYAVGVEVFHKPADYDPQRDASVRQQIGRLRQKLKEYYSGEGKDDPIRIELPMRQFRLVFSDTHPAAHPARAWIAAGIALALLPLAYRLGTTRNTAPPLRLEPDPAVRLLWQPLLDSPKPTVVCLGTPLFLRTRRTRIRDAHVNDIEAAESQTRIAELKKRLGVDSLSPSYEYTGLGEAMAAFDLAGLFGRFRRELAITRNSALSWNEIRNENVVFLGSPKFNPQIRALPVKLNFTIEIPAVMNANPRPGEQAAYTRTEDANGDAVEDYVVISRLPGINPSDLILILGGMSTTSAWAAADYLTHPETARELISRIRLPDGTLPGFFQALLHVKYREMVPLETRFVASRVLTLAKSAN